eukprot:Amastigsp_a518745_6.p2 type:complete len:136 gc:universal Amastigsp_a518745_6:727-320(-)
MMLRTARLRLRACSRPRARTAATISCSWIFKCRVSMGAPLSPAFAPQSSSSSPSWWHARPPRTTMTPRSSSTLALMACSQSRSPRRSCCKPSISRRKDVRERKAQRKETPARPKRRAEIRAAQRRRGAQTQKQRS